MHVRLSVCVCLLVVCVSVLRLALRWLAVVRQSYLAGERSSDARQSDKDGGFGVVAALSAIRRQPRRAGGGGMPVSLPCGS